MGRFSRAGDEPFSSRGLWFYLFSLSFSSRLSVSQFCLLSLNFYPSSLSSCVSVSLCLFSSQLPLSILPQICLSLSLFSLLFSFFFYILYESVSLSLFSPPSLLSISASLSVCLYYLFLSHCPLACLSIFSSKEFHRLLS